MDQSEMNRMQDPRQGQLENLQRLLGILEGLRPEKYDQILFYHDYGDGREKGCAWGWYVRNTIAKEGENVDVIALAHYQEKAQHFGVDFKEDELLFFGTMGKYGDRRRTLAQEINLVRGVIRGHEMMLEAEAASESPMLRVAISAIERSEIC